MPGPIKFAPVPRRAMSHRTCHARPVQSSDGHGNPGDEHVDLSQGENTSRHVEEWSRMRILKERRDVAPEKKMEVDEFTLLSCILCVLLRARARTLERSKDQVPY